MLNPLPRPHNTERGRQRTSCVHSVARAGLGLLEGEPPPFRLAEPVTESEEAPFLPLRDEASTAGIKAALFPIPSAALSPSLALSLSLWRVWKAQRPA